MSSLELLLLLSGISSVSILIVRKFFSEQQSDLQI